MEMGRSFIDIFYEYWMSLNDTERRQIMNGPIMRYFEYDHLPQALQEVSKDLCELAKKLDASLPDCAEKTAGLRKLLEAKDCFVRARIEDGTWPPKP